MLTIKCVDNLLRSVLLMGVLIASGCSTQNSDSAYYIGNEEAVREHMKEVEFEERVNARESNPGAAPVAPTNPAEGAGVSEEEARHRG